MISHPTGERKPQAKACGYRFSNDKILKCSKRKMFLEI
jgi:predicted Zn-ribbon and HTH transcriptional regulator